MVPREKSLNPLLEREIHQALADGLDAEAAVYETVGDLWWRAGNKLMAWKYAGFRQLSQARAEEHRLFLVLEASQ